MKVILCGYHWTGCKALDILLRAGHEVFVYTHESPFHVPDLAEYCQEVDVPYSIENVSSGSLPFPPDVVCSIYYRYLIKPHVIKECEGRIYNLHGALLPKYRGCSSLTWAMINGEDEVGFTYHYIDDGCDTGDIIMQEALQIEKWDTQETLFMRVMFEAMKYFEKVFNLVNQGVKGIPQEGESSYFPRGCPFDGKIDPNWPRDYKKRFVRSMIYPPYPVATLDGKEVKSVRELRHLLGDGNVDI